MKLPGPVNFFSIKASDFGGQVRRNGSKVTSTAQHGESKAVEWPHGENGDEYGSEWGDPTAFNR